MENPLPYTPPSTVVYDAGYEAVCVWSGPAPSIYMPLFPDTVPTYTAEELARLRLTLSLEATMTSGSPYLKLRFSGVEFEIFLTGMARFSTTYCLITATSQLVPISGGGVPPGSSSWQLIPAVSTGYSLPAAGAAPLLIEAQWTDLILHSATLSARLAPVS